MLRGVHYLPNKGTNITLIWGADLYAILIQTLQDFVTHIQTTRIFNPFAIWIHVYDNIFLTLEWLFPVALYIRFSMALTSYNISNSIKYSNKVILHNSWVLYDVVAINNLFTAL